MCLTAPAQASLPELKLSPLKYQEHMELGHAKIGYVEVSNPTSTTMHIGVEVEAFRQIDNRGQLEYYDSERLKSAITPGLDSFDLGPREAIRLKFSVDPNKLDVGGSYGVLFLRVSSGADAASQINTSARVGTLLIFDVGGSGTKTGHITTVEAPRLVFGSADIAATYAFKNTGSGDKALAYSPGIVAQIGHTPATAQDGPFVFPGRERQHVITIQAGNHIGPALITIKDTAEGGKTAHRLIFMMSGFWTWLGPLLLLFVISSLIMWQKHRTIKQPIQRHLSHGIKRPKN